MNPAPSFRPSKLAEEIRRIYAVPQQTRKHPDFVRLLTDDQEAVAKLAALLALEHMAANGNVIGASQESVICGLEKLYFEMLFGHLKGRFGVPVPTGYGKTTSAAALIVALHKANVTDRPLAVAASRVEALCDLRADINVIAERAGCLEGLANKIGMQHSYTDAVFPPTDGNEDRQFLLVTQAQLSAGLKAETVLAHASGADRLVIWDESLLPSSVFSIDLQEAFGGTAAVLSDATFHAAFSEAAAWFTDAQERLQSAQMIDAKEGAVINLPPIDDEKHKRLKQALLSGVNYLGRPASTILAG